MRIELDLPDWVDERHMRLKVDEKGTLTMYAGVELVAIKEAQNDYWKVKEGRCNGCGDCCTGLKNHIYPTVNGDCIHLKPEERGFPLPGTTSNQPQRLCAIALYRARTCDNDPREGQYKRCSITYRRVKQK